MTTPNVAALTAEEQAERAAKIAKVEQEDAERVVLNAEADKYEQLKAQAFLAPEDAAAQVNSERDPATPERFALKCTLALREQALFDDAPTPEAGRAAIVADRQDRWAAWSATMGGPPGVVSALEMWAAAMAKRHGTPALPEANGRDGATLPAVPAAPQPLCAMHGISMPWLTALLVLQYGESEYFWPAAWSEQDLRRARLWIDGLKVPGAIKGFVAIPLPTEG